MTGRNREQVILVSLISLISYTNQYLISFSRLFRIYVSCSKSVSPKAHIYSERSEIPAQPFAKGNVLSRKMRQ
jgi:hypothetical protein